MGSNCFKKVRKNYWKNYWIIIDNNFFFWKLLIIVIANNFLRLLIIVIGNKKILLGWQSVSDIFQEKQKNTCLTSHLEVFLLQPLCCNSLAKFFVKVKWWIMFLLLNFSREACQNVKKCITFHAQTPKANFCHKKCVFENCHLCTY